MYSLVFEDREFYKIFIKLAIPLALQDLIASSLNMVDTVMIGQLGETEIAAVGLSNQIFFLLNLFLFGICSGAAIFTAQFWGKRDIPGIRRVLGIGLMIGVSIAFLFSLVAFFIPGQVLGIFSKDRNVIVLGSQYLRMVCFSYMMTAITFVYAFILRSTGQVKLPMIVSVISLGLNTIFNYLLIFGHAGFPALGVEGAAIATVMARLVEMSSLLLIIYIKGYAPAAKINEMLNISVEFIKRFLGTTMPVFFNEALWSLGVTMYMFAYARMGTKVVTSVNIASTVERIALVTFAGMAHASAVMIGNQIGANDESKAFAYARKFIVLGPFLGLFMGLTVILTSQWILSIYNVSHEVYSWANKILFVLSLVMPIKIFNMINIVGILRSGGDTKFSLIIDTAGVWFIGVPLAFIGGLVWKLPIYWVYALIVLEEVFKAIIGVKRFMSKKWINNLVNCSQETA